MQLTVLAMDGPCPSFWSSYRFGHVCASLFIYIHVYKYMLGFSGAIHGHVRSHGCGRVDGHIRINELTCDICMCVHVNVSAAMRTICVAIRFAYIQAVQHLFAYIHMRTHTTHM